MNCSTPGLPVHHQLPEFTQTQVHRVSDAIQPSHPLSFPFSSCPQSLPASESFQMSQLFAWGGQSTGVSALASCYSVSKLCLALCDPVDCSTPGFPVLHYLSEFAQTHVHWESVTPSNHLILWQPLLLPFIFPSIRIFSSESALCIRWPKDWSFSRSPFNEYSRQLSRFWEFLCFKFSLPLQCSLGIHGTHQISHSLPIKGEQ